jgi:uncharacterized membrane protein YesL
MDIFTRYHAWRDKPGKGEQGSPPDKGLKRFAFILKTHFFKLIRLNLLFILFCIPVITIPASMAGMTRVLMRLTREGICDMWTDFWKEFKTEFTQRLLAWLILTVIPVIVAMLPVLFIVETPTTGLWIALSAVSYAIQCYLFPLWTILDVSLKANIRNAFALCLMEWKRSLLILITAGGVHVFCFLFFPVSAPLLLLISFSFAQLIICVIVNEPIEKHLIREKPVIEKSPVL